jgi:hypothetical protein
MGTQVFPERKPFAEVPRFRTHHDDGPEPSTFRGRPGTHDRWGCLLLPRLQTSALAPFVCPDNLWRPRD